MVRVFRVRVFETFSAHESLDIHVAEVIIKTFLETNFPIFAAAFSH